MIYKNKFFQTITLLLCVTFLLINCNKAEKGKQTTRQTTRIAISGAFALYPLVTQWVQVFQQSHPDIKFDIQAGGAGKGMADVLSGAVDLGMFSRSITQAEKDRGVWWLAVTKDAVVPTISSGNPLLPELKKRGITRAELHKIYSNNDSPNWDVLLGIEKAPEHDITVFTRSDASGAAATYAEYLGMNQEDLNGIGIYGDPGMADAVRKDNVSLGYNNTIYIYNPDTGEKNEGIEILPLDQNANGRIDSDEEIYDSFESILKAISEDKYPSPPARELYLISNGKPENESVKTFLRWVLTDGQALVRESGYVPLEPGYVKDQLKKMD